MKLYDTEKGAAENAAKLKEYWTNEGYPDVEVWVEREKDTTRKAFTVRSNLKNGRPQ